MHLPTQTLMKALRYLQTLLLAGVALSQSLRAAEGLPKTQPKLLSIIREQIKVGKGAAHARHEAGWPAAYAKANSPDYYLALKSMTGPSEVWYIAPAESHAQVAATMKRESADPVLSAEVARLAVADAEYVDAVINLQAAARPDLSTTEFPDLAKARFYEITLIRPQPGKAPLFEAIAKAYNAARKRVNPNYSARVYTITAGMPGPVYLIIMSVPDYAEFDREGAEHSAALGGATPAEKEVFDKWYDMLGSEENHRFEVDPVQSYVPKAVRDSDPSFWSPK